ncbi:MAG: hypothetical protein ABJH63_01335 [Rhizobiaceae bacterium]
MTFNIIQANVALCAEQGAWSFETHPHPHNRYKTASELAELEAVHQAGFRLAKRCKELLKVSFAIYHQRYPEFAKSGGPEQRFKAWKRHMAVDYDDSDAAFCELYLIFIRVLEPESAPGIVFCGRFSGPPENERDRFFFEHMSEIRNYALLGSGRAMSSLYLLNFPNTGVSLNPDVHYFVRVWLAAGKYFYFGAGTSTEHLKEQLPLARQRFVELAVARNDLKSVLDTTPPCEPAH